MTHRAKVTAASVFGALTVLVTGIALNRLMGLSQDWVFFPTSLLFNRVPDLVAALGWRWLEVVLYHDDTYPFWFRGIVICIHLLIWTAIIYGCLAFRAPQRVSPASVVARTQDPES